MEEVKRVVLDERQKRIRIVKNVANVYQLACFRCEIRIGYYATSEQYKDSDKIKIPGYLCVDCRVDDEVKEILSQYDKGP